MKIRNGWKSHNKQWDKFNIKLRLGFIDVIGLEIDISRKFYLFTLLNYTFKNR